MISIVDLRQAAEHLLQVCYWQKSQGGHDVNIYQQRLELHLESADIPNSFVAVTETNQAVGSISTVRYARLIKDDGSLWLANLYVDPSQRQQGIGEKLLNHALAYAQQHTSAPIYLYTTDKESYYAKRGWQPVKRGRFRRQAAVVMQFKNNLLVATED